MRRHGVRGAWHPGVTWEPVLATQGLRSYMPLHACAQAWGMQEIFINGEEVQAWVHGQDRLGRGGGRLGLQRMVDRGGLPSQSDALAREWIGTHPPRKDRRGALRRPEAATEVALVMPEGRPQRRRAG